MKVFTHSEYIKYIHILRLNAVLQLAEGDTDYKYNNAQKNKKTHDKLLKSILKNSNELAKFINEFITDELNLLPDDLVKFTNSYVTKRYKAKEADLVYKLKGEDIFFLIEHQSTIDNSMPYRMLNYCIDIMYEWCKSQNINTINQYPLIVPIVIYTGNRKWQVSQNFEDKQIGTEVLKNYKINFKYNLIDINTISKERFFKQNSMFGYGMIIEKCKDRKDLIENLHSIVKKCNNKQHLEALKEIIIYAINDSFLLSEKEEILQKIERKVDETNMSTLVERLAAENKRMINQGIRKGREIGIKAGIKTGMETKENNVIKKMLAMKFEDKVILEITGTTMEELEKIKKQKDV